jgi:hypothetical protein
MTVNFRHEGVEVIVLPGPYLSGGEPTQDALTYSAQLIAEMNLFRQYAASSLLPLYSEVWLDESIGILDEHAFANKLAAPTVHLYDELGTALVYFEDGGIFAGHSIEITIKNGEPCHAQIIG